MGTVKGYLVVGKKKGVKHFYLPSIKIWVSDFRKISLADIKEKKLEMNMEDHPEMDPEYSHEEITISGNTDY